MSFLCCNIHHVCMISLLPLRTMTHTHTQRRPSRHLFLFLYDAKHIGAERFLCATKHIVYTQKSCMHHLVERLPTLGTTRCVTCHIVKHGRRLGIIRCVCHRPYFSYFIFSTIIYKNTEYLKPFRTLFNILILLM